MATKAFSRRELLSSTFRVSALVMLSGCSKKKAFSCSSVDGLAAEDVLPRNKLAYSDVAADPAKTCDACQQFVPAANGDGCGGCKIMKGPIHPGGSCRSFARKG